VGDNSTAAVCLALLSTTPSQVIDPLGVRGRGGQVEQWTVRLWIQARGRRPQGVAVQAVEEAHIPDQVDLAGQAGRGDATRCAIGERGHSRVGEPVVDGRQAC
jgi:hypothetical protein